MSYAKWRVFKGFQLCCSYEIAPEEKARQKQRYDPNICPECGGRLRLIQGPFGKFMGCEDYPTCKFNRRVRKK